MRETLREKSCRLADRVWQKGTLLITVAILIIGVPAWCQADNQKLKIGVIGPMKFQPGENHWAGAELAAEEINASGGIRVGGKNYLVELVKADSNEMKSVPDAISAMERIVTVDKVDFLTGGFRSEAVLGMQDIAAKYKKVFINVGSAHPELTGRIKKEYDKYKYFFRFGSINSYIQMGLHTNALDMLAKEIRKKLGFQKPKVAFLAEKVLWADPVYKLLESKAQELGIEMIGEWRPSYTANDLAAELTAIKSAGAHIIYTGLTGPVSVTFSRQWGELKIPAAAIGVNMQAQQMTHWDTTAGMTEYEAFWTTLARIKVTDKTIPFIDKFTKKYNMFPAVYAQTYDALYILKDAIEKGKTLDADALVKVLEQTEYNAVSGKIAFFKPDQEWPHDMIWGAGYVTNFFSQWIKGEQVAVWPPPGGEWQGVAYEGSKYYQLPPWVESYWKGKK